MSFALADQLAGGWQGNSAAGTGQTVQAAGVVLDGWEAECGHEVGPTAENEDARDPRVGH
jgi:hypothetical protein